MNLTCRYFVLISNALHVAVYCNSLPDITFFAVLPLMLSKVVLSWKHELNCILLSLCKVGVCISSHLQLWENLNYTAQLDLASYCWSKAFQLLLCPPPCNSYIIRNHKRFSYNNIGAIFQSGGKPATLGTGFT